MNRKISRKWIIYNGIIFVTLIIAIVYVVYLESINKSDKNLDFVMSMGAGFNLGNAMDSHGIGKNIDQVEKYETYWGNPVIKEETILAVKKAGFLTIRIPVTWYEHMDEDGNIDVLWMDRVNEVVDYGINNGMYVIINTHHENWIQPLEANRKKSSKLLTKVWEQIAQRFSKYDQHLIFEAINEPRLIGSEYEWNAGTAQARKIVNDYNQIFVDTIRSIPGNKDRYLMVSPYGNSSDEQALNDFVLPKDRKLIVTVHAYKPYNFTHDEKGIKNWSASDQKDTHEIDLMMSSLYNNFIEKRIPVIIGEFGAIDKDNVEDRQEYTRYYVSRARQYNMMCIWWDDSVRKDKKERFGILDRQKNVFVYPGIAKVLVKDQPLPEMKSKAKTKD